MTETTAVANPRSFEDRLRDRLRENIGDVMTDEDLKNLVDRGLDDILFKERIKQRTGGYHSSVEYDPPLIHVLLLEQLEPMLKQVVREWVNEHSDEVMAAFDKTMQDGLGQVMLNGFAALFDNALHPVRQQVWDIANRTQ